MYQEPVGHQLAGQLRYKRLRSAYETFMEEQDIPIYRGIGVYDVRQLTLAPWKRLGGQGTFIHLNGMGDLWGMYLIEVPAGGAVTPERHIYEELFLVFEGRGSTEVWKEGSAKKTFEWQPGTHFAIPLNAWHRLVNATSSPALVMAATSAPPIMSTFQNYRFIFDNPFDFSERYGEREDYFKPQEKFEPEPETGRAMLRSSVLPDIFNCYLPLDNQRSPGYRWFAPKMAGNTYFGGFIAQHSSGHYSKAHYHPAGAVLVCMQGKGYTYTWPVELGIRPWEAGKGELVKRQDYIPGGVVSAAPGGGDWFHQHFSIGKEPLRIRAIIAGVRRFEGGPGEEVTSINEDLARGGHTIPYREEDPFIRKTYLQAIAKEGVELQMPKDVFR